MVSDPWGVMYGSSPLVAAFQSKCPPHCLWGALRALAPCGNHRCMVLFHAHTCRAVQCPVPGPGRGCHCRWGVAEAALPSCRQSGSPRLLNGEKEPSSQSTWVGICLCNPLLFFFVLLPIHTKAALYLRRWFVALFFLFCILEYCKEMHILIVRENQWMNERQSCYHFNCILFKAASNAILFLSHS